MIEGDVLALKVAGRPLGEWTASDAECANGRGLLGYERATLDIMAAIAPSLSILRSKDTNGWLRLPDLDRDQAAVSD